VYIPTKPRSIGPMLVFGWNGWHQNLVIGFTLAQLRSASVHERNTRCWN